MWIEPLFQLEHRKVQMNDPKYPSVRVSGDLNKLVLHMNEEKIQSITTFLYSFFKKEQSEPPTP